MKDSPNNTNLLKSINRILILFEAYIDYNHATCKKHDRKDDLQLCKNLKRKFAKNKEKLSRCVKELGWISESCDLLRTHHTNSDTENKIESNVSSDEVIVPISSGFSQTNNQVGLFIC